MKVKHKLCYKYQVHRQRKAQKRTVLYTKIFKEKEKGKLEVTLDGTVAH